MTGDFYGVGHTMNGYWPSQFQPSPCQPQWPSPNIGGAFPGGLAALEGYLQSRQETKPVAIATGKKPIVLTRSGVQTEFDTQDAALQEASRLAGKNDDEYVVYIPVAIVRPKKDVTIETLAAAT